MTSARIIIEVVAGLIPGQHSFPEHTRRFVITSDEWHDRGPDERLNLLALRNTEAQAYAMTLMLQPDQFNWVRTEWIYL